MTRDSSDAAAELIGCAALVGGFVFLMMLTTILNGWAISVVWNMYAVPALHVPSIGIIDAIGLSLLVTLFVHPKTDDDAGKSKEQKRKEWVMSIVLTIILPLIVVGVATFWHWYWFR